MPETTVRVPETKNNQKPSKNQKNGRLGQTSNGLFQKPWRATDTRLRPIEAYHLGVSFDLGFTRIKRELRSPKRKNGLLVKTCFS